VVQFAGSHLETHQGRVDLPPGESFGLMFVHCTEVFGFRFAGLLHDTDGTMLREWHDGAWSEPFHTDTGRIVYDHNGQIRDEAPAGYQFVDDSGIPISRLVTYPVLDGLNEWTATADIRIGQGHEDGQGVCVHTADGVLRQLEPGDCRFVNVHREGEHVAIAYVVPDGAVIVQTTLAELRGLPAVGMTLPNPGTPPVTPMPPPVTPKPEPKPMPTIPDNEIARAKAEIAAHPLGDNLPDLPWTTARVRALGGRWGLNGKRGNRNDPSHDIFAYQWSDDASQQPILVDTLGDGGGANIEAFQILPWPEPAGAVWIDPGAATVPDPAQPPAARGAGAQIDAELAALLTRLSALENKVAVLESKPVVAPAPVSLAGQRIALKTNDGHYLCADRTPAARRTARRAPPRVPAQADRDRCPQADSRQGDDRRPDRHCPLRRSARR
jgi:hypothetical protein